MYVVFPNMRYIWSVRWAASHKKEICCRRWYRLVFIRTRKCARVNLFIILRITVYYLLIYEHQVPARILRRPHVLHIMRRVWVFIIHCVDFLLSWERKILIERVSWIDRMRGREKNVVLVFMPTTAVRFSLSFLFSHRLLGFYRTALLRGSIIMVRPGQTECPVVNPSCFVSLATEGSPSTDRQTHRHRA